MKNSEPRMTPISDVGLAHLKTLVNLRDLFLFDTQVSDAGLSQFDPLTNLQYVRMLGTHVTDAGAADLRNRKPTLLVYR